MEPRAGVSRSGSRVRVCARASLSGTANPPRPSSMCLGLHHEPGCCRKFPPQPRVTQGVRQSWYHFITRWQTVPTAVAMHSHGRRRCTNWNRSDTMTSSPKKRLGLSGLQNMPRCPVSNAMTPFTCTSELIGH
eukprot:316351-Rhodomonas_salina.2